MDLSTFWFNWNFDSHGLDERVQMAALPPGAASFSRHRGWWRAGEGSPEVRSLHRMDQISLKFWLESELEFGYGNPSENYADDQPTLSPQPHELGQVCYLDVDPYTGQTPFATRKAVPWHHSNSQFPVPFLGLAIPWATCGAFKWFWQETDMASQGQTSLICEGQISWRRNCFWPIRSIPLY